MARKRKNRGEVQPLDTRYHKMHARTERMHGLVRLSCCLLALVIGVAFAVGALPHYRKLEKMRADLEEVKFSESEVANRVDAKKRELNAIEKDPQYRELIARDRLNYYEPGEHVFRIER